MKEYSYNPDPRVNQDNEFKSFEELTNSDGWKSDKGKYVFQQHIPNFCEGFDVHVLTFETVDGMLEYFAEKSHNCLLKVQWNKEDCYLMEYRWEKENENKDDSDGHREAYLKKNLGDRWQDYNWWWVLGYVSRKDGNTMSKKECIEMVCE